MSVFPISSNLTLPVSEEIDFFLLQWHTTWPLEKQIIKKIPEDLVNKKRMILEKFRDYLINIFDKVQSSRPLFLIAPELSMPFSLRDVLKDILANIHRPTVIIAGFEYLQWDEYVNHFNLLKDMPDEGSWHENITGTPWVNSAGIWIRDNDRIVREFIQPKMSPNDPERALGIHEGQSSLFFESTHGHLDFCVKICSDFINSSLINNLKECIVNNCNSKNIDFTILLQFNEDQKAHQFYDATKNYFVQKGNMARTSSGCIVYVNNANSDHEKSNFWGESRFDFPYNTWRMSIFDNVPPPRTYWINNKSDYSHQAVILRHSGPSIYQVKYKPHCLVSKEPGTDNPCPFHSCLAFLIPIDVNIDQIDENKFVNIHAIPHWVELDWKSYEKNLYNDINSNLKQSVKDKGIESEILSAFKGVYEALLFNSKDDPSLISTFINTFFICANEVLHRKNHNKQIEPKLWPPIVSDALKKLLLSYSFLLIGASSFPHGKLTLNNSSGVHAKGGNDLYIIFSWGGNRYLPDYIIDTHLNELSSRGSYHELFKSILFESVNKR